MIKTIALCILFSVGVHNYSVAQIYQDIMMRNSVGIKAELSPKFSVDVSLQSRLQNNLQVFNGMFFYCNPKFQISDNFFLLTDIRYGTGSLWDRMRYGIGFQYKYPLKKIKFSVRGLYQYEHFEQSLPDIGQYPDRNNFRMRVLSEYKMTKRMSVFAAIEPLYRIEQSVGRFQRIRNTIGIEWEILKRHTVTASLFIQPQYQPSLQRIHYIANVGYTFELPSLYDKRNTLSLGDE